MEKRVSFDEIRANNIRSTLLIMFFLLLMGVIGLAVGYVWGNLLFGVILTLIAATIYALIAYFQGKNMITRMTKAEPLTKKEFPHAYHAIEGLSLAAGVPVPEMYVIRTSARNAFATGRNPENSAVVLTTGLIEALDRSELEGVIAHELAHIKNRDIRTMMIGAVITGIILFLSQVLLRSVFFGGGRRDNNGKGQLIAIAIALILAILSPIIAEMIKLAISRKREYAADAGAAVMTRYPDGLASALKKIAADPKPEQLANKATNHLYISSPEQKKTSWWSNAFSTHPPIQERIKRLTEM